MIIMKSPAYKHPVRRKGTAIVMVAVSSTALIGFAALAVDLGMLYNVRAELQRTADASALAAAYKLLDEDALQGQPNIVDEVVAARLEAQNIAAVNPVALESPQLANDDIQVGYLSGIYNYSENINFNNPPKYNTVQVVARRDNTINGPVNLFFARIFGIQSTSVTATASAAMMDGVTGFRVTENTGNADVLPMALHVDAWNNVLAHIGSVTDDYTYDSDTGAISGGPDGIYELNLFPGSGDTQLPPGNFGTVDIGAPNNSTADLSRQIRYGITAADLAYIGGELALGEDGTLLLNGDTGISAAIKDDLEYIKGLPRTIPLFNAVSGNGNNAMYTIVGFAGIRILDVKLTGPMKYKHVTVQPAFVIDDSAITSQGANSSYFVYQPPVLVR